MTTLAEKQYTEEMRNSANELVEIGEAKFIEMLCVFPNKMRVVANKLLLLGQGDEKTFDYLIENIKWIEGFKCGRAGREDFTDWDVVAYKTMKTLNERFNAQELIDALPGNG